LIIVKTVKKLLMLDYGLSNAIFETSNHVFAPKILASMKVAREENSCENK